MMKTLRTAFLASLVVLTASTVWAQFGTYGSPEILKLPPLNSPAATYGSHTPGPPYSQPAAAPGRQWDPAYAPSAGMYPGAMLPARYAGPYARLQDEPAPPGPSPQAAPGPNPNMVEQMLGGSNCYEQANDCAYPGGNVLQDQCGSISQAAECFEQAACGEYCSPWYGSVAVLVMGRDRANRVWTTYETGNNSNQMTHTDFGMKWRWGGEIRFGRRFCCDQWALEATYWTLDAMDGFVSTTNPGGTVSTPLVVSGIEFGGINGTVFFDNAAEHRLWRRNEFQNVELNVIRNPMSVATDSHWDIDWLAGVRFFRFEERLVFGSLRPNFTWGGNGGANEAYLDDQIINYLVGFQFGFDANYQLTRSLRLFVAPKFGIYNNHIDHTFRAYLGNGTVANPTAISGQTGTYPVESATDVVSFLTQLDIGGEWQYAPNWSLRAGYRVVAVTGVGLADNQIPPYIVDIPEIAAIDHNANLILHGAYAGVTYNY